MSPWRRRPTPENPLPKGHPFRFQPSLASATGALLMRHVGARGSLGAVRPPWESTGPGQWVAVASALCFAVDRPLAGGLMGVGGLLWAEWAWIEELDVEGEHLRVRFRTGRERSQAEYREVELSADDPSAAARLVEVCRTFL